MNCGWGMSHDIAHRWMPLDLTDDKSTLVQVMVWCHQATSHYLSQCWPRSLSPNGVTRPQWVQVSTHLQTDHISRLYSNLAVELMMGTLQAWLTFSHDPQNWAVPLHLQTNYWWDWSQIWWVNSTDLVNLRSHSSVFLLFTGLWFVV